MAAIRTKICGITRLPDAKAVCEAAADAIGLNFYAKSKRFIDVLTAAAIAENIEGRIAVFGVFVNATTSDIKAICSNVALSYVQLHGDEPVELVAEIRAEIPGVKIVRAVRVSNDDFESAQQEIDAWQAANVDMILLDAASLDAFGGTGKQLDWSRLSQFSIGVPWLLAGGLDPSNVGTAIATGWPNGVDTASGVESKPGVKDSKMVTDFVTNAKAGFANLEEANE